MRESSVNPHNADLPRPRDFSETFYDAENPSALPPLKRTGNPAEETRTFSTTKIRKIEKVMQARREEEYPDYEEPEEDIYYDYDEDEMDYGAYEEYDRAEQTPPKKKKKSAKTAKNTKSSRTAGTSQQSHKKSVPPKKHHAHGGGILGRLLRPVLTIVVIIFLLYSAVAFLLIRQLEHLPREPRTFTNGALDTDYVRNVLLIGTDSRDLSAERGRSDTMLLMSLNSKTKQIYLTSFMRDAYVQIPGYGGHKLNAAYSYGGAELLMDTIEQNYQISIDDYCCISFLGFAGIIDAFGGVEITLSDAEAGAVNTILQSEVNGLAGDDPMSDFIEKGGTYILNGKQALSYARIRYVGNADFERTSRQREVMTQLLSHARTRAATAVPKLISTAMPHLGTNMSDIQMYLLSLRVPFALGYDITQIQIPADGTYTPADIDGQSVLQVNLESNIQVLRDTVYAVPAEEPAVQ